MQKTVVQLLLEGSSELSAEGVFNAMQDARLLLRHATGKSTEEIIAHPDMKVTASAEREYRNYLKRRGLEHEPVSRIIGKREFWGFDFVVTPDTLDPRQDTETVIDAAKEIYKNDAPKRILDVGTGTGCILMALLHEFQLAKGVGVDVSDDALVVARSNANRLTFSNRTTFIYSNWLEEVEGTFDLIVSNPPYIRTKDMDDLPPDVIEHDPHLALDGGKDGLECYRALLPQAKEKLNAGGWIVLECGDGQAPDLEQLLDKYGFANVASRKDLTKTDRVVRASVL